MLAEGKYLFYYYNYHFNEISIKERLLPKYTLYIYKNICMYGWRRIYVCAVMYTLTCIGLKGDYNDYQMENLNWSSK